MKRALIKGVMHAVLILGVMCAIPFFIARAVAEMSGGRR